MLKKILKVDGAKELDKKEQSQITGGVDPAVCTACGGVASPGNCLMDLAVCICIFGIGECNF
ncbi:MAG: hypothetical protein AAF617_02790 [Bacteroidota bacterium]